MTEQAIVTDHVPTRMSGTVCLEPEFVKILMLNSPGHLKLMAPKQDTESPSFTSHMERQKLCQRRSTTWDPYVTIST